MPRPIALGVNVDHVATIRQARGAPYPDPVAAALQAEAAGADGITMHLREDRRHVQDDDLARMAACAATKLNMEMAATDEMRDIALRLRPLDACIVPERRAELTTEGGLDVARNLARITELTAALTAAGIRVSLFIDPERAQIDAAAKAGAPVVELHTGRYAAAAGMARAMGGGDDGERDGDAAGDSDSDGGDGGAPSPVDSAEFAREWAAFTAAVDHASAAGLTVNAGHGLHYANTARVAELPAIHELNIGHAIVARALSVGFPTAVGEMKRLMVEARAKTESE